MKNYIIIPARKDSKRLPGKALLNETGKPLFVHTYERLEVLLSFGLVEKIYIASPCEEIIYEATKRNIPTITTVPSHCGSHTAMIAAKLINQYCNIVNVQVDYPMINPDVIRQVISAIHETNSICSAYYKTKDKESASSPNNVKCVIDSDKYANYFSRSEIPYNSDEWNIHLGVYGFPYCKWNSIQNIYLDEDKDYKWGDGENLEQLMWLYHGYKIKMIETDPCLGIDTKEDYEQFKKFKLT